MSEQPLTLSTEEVQTTDLNKMQDFKKTCFGIGLVVIITFVARHLATLVSGFLKPLFAGADNLTIQFADLILSIVFLNLIPIFSAYFILIYKKNKGIVCAEYRKPKYFANAMGMFPAMYGIAIGINALVVWLSGFFRDTAVGESLNALENLQPLDTPSALVLLFQLVVVAPVCEELWFRGIILQSLRPYGNGFAIFVSGMLFGITHANIQQGLYATVIGIVLGYIAVSTKSVVTTTIMHAILNSISGIMMLLMTFPEAKAYMEAAETGTAMTPEGSALILIAYLLLVVILLLVGAGMAIYKLVHIRRYRVEKVWHGVSAGRRWVIFLTTVTIIIGLLLAIEQMTMGFITDWIISLFAAIAG